MSKITVYQSSKKRNAEGVSTCPWCGEDAASHSITEWDPAYPLLVRRGWFCGACKKALKEDSLPSGWVPSECKLTDGNMTADQRRDPLEALHVVFVDAIPSNPQTRLYNSEDTAVFLLPPLANNPTSLKEGVAGYLGRLLHLFVENLCPDEVIPFPLEDGRLVVALWWD